MVQIADVQIGSNHYMVQPGKYRRMSDGVREGVMERLNLTDFVAGQRRALQLEKDRGWDAEGCLPVYGGQGIEPSPNVLAYSSDGVIGVPSSTIFVPTLLWQDRLYVGIDRFLYRSVAMGAAWGPFTMWADMGAGNVITGLANFIDRIAVACGAAKDIQTVTAAGVVATMTVGEKGYEIIGYANCLMWDDASGGSRGSTLKMTTGGGIDSRKLDSPIQRLTYHAGKVAIGTRSSIYLLGGKGIAASSAWSADPDPVFSQSLWTDPDDYQTLISYGGKLYAWLGNQLMEYNPMTGNNRQGWKPTGLEGIESFGATVTGNWLIVSIRNLQGTGELWGFDGSGWWLMETGIVRCWPASLSGLADRDLIAFRHGSTTYDLFRTVHRSTALHAFRTTGHYKTSLLHAMQPAALKAWAAIKASFSVPEAHGNTGSADSVTVAGNYSIDGGATWTQFGVLTTSAAGTRTFVLGGDLPAPVESRTLQIEIVWSSISDWAPVLTGIHVDYQLIESQTRRRRWEFDCQVADRNTQRDGSIDARTGRQIRADLWSAWAAGSTLTFRDVDYDVTATQFDVRIVSIQEKIDRPTDETLQANNPISLVLVEI